MKLTNNQMIALATGVLVLLALKTRKKVAAANTKQADPENWGEDAYARLHGRDLSLDGNHPVPAPLDVYGVTNTLAWAYPPTSLEAEMPKEQAYPMYLLKQ